MTVGAAVVAYHTRTEDLDRCLQSLRTEGVKQIVVVDNSPSSNLRTTTYRHGGRYLPQIENEGFAAGANHAASHLTTDASLFLNPDAYLIPGAVTQARRWLKDHPRCGIVGLTLTSPAGSIEVNSFGPIVTPLSLITRHLTAKSFPSVPQRVGWVSAGAMVVRRSTFRELGGFDPTFFLYWEDVDFCRRAHAAGWQIVLLPLARAMHHRGASLSDNQRRMLLYDRSADNYFCKHYAKTICLPLRYLRRLYRLWLPAHSA